MHEKIVVRAQKKGSSLKFRKALAKEFFGDAFSTTNILSFSHAEVEEFLDGVDGQAVTSQVPDWRDYKRIWLIYPDR